MKLPRLFTARDGGREMARIEAPAGAELVQPAKGDMGSIGNDAAGYMGGITDYMAGGPDTNPDLQGRRRFDVYREMKHSDPAVRSLSWLYKLPVRSASWAFFPNPMDPDGIEVARARAHFAEWQFGLGDYNTPRLAMTWDQLNQQDLNYLDYGCMGGEMEWGDIEAWTDADGDVHTVRPLINIGARFPQTIIDIDRRNGVIQKIQQEDSARGVTVNGGWIPGSKITWLTFDREGDNVWGTSALRAAYGAWLIKRELIVNGAIAFDRYSMGIPLVRHPEGTTEERRAKAIARGIRSHERAYVTLEGQPVGQGGNSEWSVDIVNGSGSIANPVEFLKYLDQQIAVAGLQQFSTLGMSSAGSRAAAQVLVEPFYLAVQAVAQEVASERMRQVVRRLWDVNFGTHIPVPTLNVSKIQGRNIDALAQAISMLASAGLSFTDPETQNDIRDLVDLRHLPVPEQIKQDVEEALQTVKEDGGVGVTGNPAAPAPAEGGSVVARAAA